MTGETKMRQIAIALALLGIAGTASPALAASLTRTSSFTYDATSGLLPKEVVEPGSGFELDTTYTYDAFGNKTSATVSSPVTGSAAITSRSSSSTYDAAGQFVTSQSNALSQSESWQYDARFG